MSFEISIKKFRNAVDQIRDQRDATLIKTSYLLASRASEILTKTNPVEILNNKSKSYGNFMTLKFENYEVASTPNKESVMHKALVITTAVAKRGKRLKQPKEGEEQTTPQLVKEEVIEALTKYGETKLLDKWKRREVEIDPLLIQVLLGKVKLKAVALPVDPSYEPWVMDLLGWMQKIKRTPINFDLTRRRYHQIVRENLGDILPKPHKRNPRNFLRHWRLTHLTEYYSFDAMQLTNFAGWSIVTAAKEMGMAASPNVDHYVHLRWRQYFPRLLKPIKNFM